ncbi:hypothetical protein [Sphingomonas trueperi]|uniref:hypothetical protein n=1 Tax=Sphingomonas trueperi TaxID=53317 RepID=UPI000F2987D5
MNNTWSQGNQRSFHGIGSQADCGQYAANRSGPYKSGSIDGFTHAQQPLAYRTPASFNFAHARSANYFVITPIPAIATAIAYFNLANHGFHYARIERDADGNFTGLSQTDANLSGLSDRGNGLFTHFHVNRPAEEISRRGVQTVVYLNNLHEFVNYCRDHYDLENGYFYFCYFD